MTDAMHLSPEDQAQQLPPIERVGEKAEHLLLTTLDKAEGAPLFLAFAGLAVAWTVGAEVAPVLYKVEKGVSSVKKHGSALIELARRYRQ